MTMGLLLASLFLQPVWWVGLFREWHTANSRIRTERKLFGSAVYQEKYELKHYITESLILGVIASIFSFLVGISIPLEWWLLYVLAALVGGLILPAGAPLLVIAVSLVAFFGNQLYGLWTLPVDAFRNAGFGASNPATANLVMVLGFMLILFGGWLRRVGGRYNSPKILTKQRGKTIAGYRFNELTVVPMLVLLPGDWLSSHLAFWPTLTVGQHQFTLLFLPLLLGLRWTILKQVPRVALKRLANQMMVLGVLGVIAAIVSRFIPDAAIWAMGVILLLAILVVLASHLRDQKQDFWFSDVDHGVRVIGIKPGTPAEKMTLNIGDIILECNHVAINDEDEFYRALQQNPTYCHLRIQDPDGQLKVSETAIFADSPHEIGVVLFQK